MGSRMKATKPRLFLPPSLLFVHLLPSFLKKESPQRRRIILARVDLNFLAYVLANFLRVKPHWWRPEPNATLPVCGSRVMSPRASSLYVAMMTLTFSMAFWKDVYASSGGSFSSSTARSSLLSISTGLMRSEMAWRSTVSVCTQTPSMQSTTTRAPSVTRRAAVTSDEKSTWPGESMRLMRNDFSLISTLASGSTTASSLASSAPPAASAASAASSAASSASSARSVGRSYSKYIEIPVDLMVMHRSCSSARVSVNRVSPALADAMMPALDTRESVSVDLPWSTWAITLMLRMLLVRSMMDRSCS
mmetsp:Transcript_6539/g.8838  ORF Transcript_6539/g.8838 Transcript_6539/m.8838 type:complete len:305 (+) Transcript_6539:2125-3039(+)